MMHKNSQSTNTLHEIIAHDDVLRLRTFIRPVHPFDQYETDYLELLAKSLRMRSWYCACYFLTRVDVQRYNDRAQSELLWASIISDEPEMYRLVKARPSVLFLPGLGDMNIPSYIASNALNGLAQSLAESWDGAWRSIEILPRIEHTMYSISATVQTLVPTPDAMKSNACERVLARRRSRCEDTYLVQSALVKNDWMLIDYLIQNEPATVTKALSSAGADARIPWILHRAASSNAGDALQSIAHLVDIDVIDERGNTPLHIAAMCGNITSVKKLIEVGADPTARNHNGDTPLDLCVSLTRTYVRCAYLIAMHLPVKLRDEYRTRWWYLSAPETLRQLLYDPRQFESEHAP